MTKFGLKVLTPREQYDNLVYKGIRMDKEQEEILNFLTHNSYFSLKFYFCNHTSWSLILQDYGFDKELRILIFSHIITIENSFKNIFCQISCQRLGDTWWTEKKNYTTRKISFFERLWEKILSLGQKKKDKKRFPQVFENIVKPKLDALDSGNIQSGHEGIKRYKEQYSDPKYPPFRMMIQLFTFGDISKLYSGLADTQIKKEIGRVYEVDDGKLQNRMEMLVNARNDCAHHKKLFDKVWKIAKVRNIETMVGNKSESTYHLCCVIYYLLQHIQQDNSFKTDLKALLEKYPEVKTNFPVNWEEFWEE